MAYDYTKKSKVSKYRSIVQYSDKTSKTVGYICFGGNKGYMRLNSSFIKEKGQVFLQILPPTKNI
jgi:hypothetical protein